ncbi:unnamed protein product [Clonostachys rosea f. rosea IK726]|uniref:Uncharacterized protein n=1 Tax=Clonostachys rosea f. rosea IK726 TaxID=1349383 RepID=A0ACA9THS9_BIOOC|nr:unnamed protein product [Clonostachys rosea f. rosea IK726]
MADRCSCGTPTVFIGLDIGATFSGAFSVLAKHCREYKVFKVIGEVEVEKFPSVLIREGMTGAKFLPPKETVKPDDQILSYFKMGVLDLTSDSFSLSDAHVVQGLKDCWQKQPTYVIAPGAFSTFLHGLYRYSETTSRFKWPFSRSAYDVRHMVTEEEHVAALRGLMQSEPETIQLLTDAKETAIICDIGGLTTDVVVHRFCPIVGPSASPRVWMSRLNSGCLIDEAYSRELDGEIERHIPRSYRQAHADELKQYKDFFMTQWREKDKLEYDPANYGVSLNMQIGEWTLTIQHTVFIRLFAQLLDHVFSIVKEVHERECCLSVRPPTKVILVGGLSQCTYLVNVLTERFATLKLDIIQPPAEGRYVSQTAVDF